MSVLVTYTLNQTLMGSDGTNSFFYLTKLKDFSLLKETETPFETETLL